MNEHEFPLNAVPSWMVPEQRRTFWDHIAQSNILEMWRARDEFDEGVDPESVRGKALALMDELERMRVTVGAAVDGLDTEQAAQDFADGAALRRLREALPPVGEGVYTLDVTMWNTGGVWVEVATNQAVVAHGTAATIAEAADKCREALER